MNKRCLVSFGLNSIMCPPNGVVSSRVDAGGVGLIHAVGTFSLFLTDAYFMSKWRLDRDCSGRSLLCLATRARYWFCLCQLPF